ncbi:MAG: diaminopimelate decarboxylase [Planctomycetota bacterium]|jgi:diaminopimelate decarboxylase
MDHFTYRNNQLYCEEVPVSRIAEAVGTPTYIYSSATLIHHYQQMASAFAELNAIICFSIKSCQNIHIIRLLTALGAGIDVVSGGELYRALKGGADPSKIVFASVGKTDQEINEAIDARIGWFNIESEAELANIITIAQKRKETVRAALRINPDVDPKTHRHTTTGKKETKFGVDIDRARKVFNQFGGSEYVKLDGIHLHIGSPVYTIEPYTQAIGKALALIEDLRKDGFTINTLDIGGGFGADYKGNETPEFANYAQQIVPLLRDSGLQVILEPGRSISGNAGILLIRATYIKQGGDKQFVIIDGAMTDLIRPALYDAYHFIWPVRPGKNHIPAHRGADQKASGLIKVDVVGPVCESTDFLAQERLLPPVKRGDLLAVFTAGAFGFVMASHYNSRPNAAEVLVDGENFSTIRRRESYEDLMASENV